MYTVVDFNLPKGLNLELQSTGAWNFFEPQAGSYDRQIAIPIPDTGGGSILLCKFLRGQVLSLRKTVLGGLRIVRDTPDYSGYVEYVDLRSHMDRMIQGKKDNYRAMEALASLSQRNLCQEIILPGNNERDQAYSESIQRRYIEQGVGLETFADYIERAERAEVVPGRRIEPIYWPSYGTVTGRSAGMGVPPRHPDIGRSRPLQDYYHVDFSRFEYTERRRRIVEQPSPPVEYLPDQTYSVIPVSIAQAFDAASEVARNERGTPPASRGPRPRNQRW